MMPMIFEPCRVEAGLSSVESGSAEEEEMSGREPMLCRDPSLPAEIRLGFVKKVYGILAAMLVVSFVAVYPFVFHREAAMVYLCENLWIPLVAVVALLLHHFVNMAIVCERCCCPGGPCLRTYLRMFVTVPCNYVFCMTYAVCMGVALGIVCSAYKAESICSVFLLAVASTAALTIYAVRTSADFTGNAACWLTLGVGLVQLAFLSVLFPGHPLLHRAIAVILAVAMSWKIIHDTQLIFGDLASKGGSSAAGTIQFTVDMYCLAAYQLYLGFVNLFVQLLKLFGARR